MKYNATGNHTTNHNKNWKLPTATCLFETPVCSDVANSPPKDVYSDPLPRPFSSGEYYYSIVSSINRYSINK